MTTLLPPPTDHLSISPVLSARATLSLPTSNLLAGVVERLYRENECCLLLTTVIDVVSGCLHDIQATPMEALPELTERLARHRLSQVGHPGCS
ncbi:MAG: hypothetical protein ABIQ09_03545 [Jatrophihabitantaceae bacterium]